MCVKASHTTIIPTLRSKLQAMELDKENSVNIRREYMTMYFFAAEVSLNRRF